MSSESGRFLRFNPATSVRRQSDVAEPRKRRAKTILDEGRPLLRSGHVPISLMESECYKMEAATCSGLPPFGWPKGLSQPVRRATKMQPDPSTHAAPGSRFHERPPAAAASLQGRGRPGPVRHISGRRLLPMFILCAHTLANRQTGRPISLSAGVDPIEQKHG